MNRFFPVLALLLLAHPIAMAVPWFLVVFAMLVFLGLLLQQDLHHLSAHVLLLLVLLGATELVSHLDVPATLAMQGVSRRQPLYHFSQFLVQPYPAPFSALVLMFLLVVGATRGLGR